MLHQTPVLFFQPTAELQDWKDTSVLPSEITRRMHFNEQWIQMCLDDFLLPYTAFLRFWTQSVQSSVNVLDVAPLFQVDR